MAVKQEVLERSPVPRGQVEWAITNDQLARYHLPAQYRYKRRGVQVDTRVDVGTGKGTIAMGIFSLTPKDSGEKGLMHSSVDTDVLTLPVEQLKFTRQAVRPPAHLDPNFNSEHVTDNTRTPYVVLNDGTRYAIGVWISKDLITPWKQRVESDQFYSLKGETVYERQSVALLVRIDGEHPLQVEKKSSADGPDKKYEIYTAIPDPSTQDGDEVLAVFTHRITGDSDESKLMKPGDSSKQKAEGEPFQLVRLNRKERKNGMTSSGSVQLVAVRITEYKTVKKPVVISDTRRERSWDSLIFRGAAEPAQTKFGKSETVTVTVSKMHVEEPIAELNLSLVAPRRRSRIGYRMTGVDPTKKRDGYKSGE